MYNKIFLEVIMKKKVIVAILVVALMGVMFGFGYTLASTGDRQITATLSETITVKYNGEVQRFVDGSGRQVFPILFEGTTYLPLRAMSDLLGVPVSWDAANRTVNLGDAGAPSAPTPPTLNARPLASNGTWQGTTAQWQTIQGAANIPQPAGQTVTEGFISRNVNSALNTRTFRLNEGVSANVLEFTSYVTTNLPDQITSVHFEVRNATTGAVLFTGDIPVHTFNMHSIELFGATDIQFRARTRPLAGQSNDLFILAPTVR